MKRDFELVRNLLLEVEKTPAGSDAIIFGDQVDHDKQSVFEHLDLMIDAGLLKGKILRCGNSIQAVAVSGLTWEGHDFLKAAAEDTLWKKAFSTAKEKGVALTFDVLKSLLAKLAMNQAGLS